MNKSERIAKKINEKIPAWSKDRAKLIVAIDGYAGSGKTTVADLIGKQNPGVLVVHLDDFVNHWKVRNRMIDETKNKSDVFEYKWYRYEELEKLVRAFKSRDTRVINIETYDFTLNDFRPPAPFDLSKKILIVEGIFLFHSEHAISKLWDRTVYLDADFAKADKRRVAREKEIWGKMFVPDGHPGNWIEYFKQAYRRYVRERKPQLGRDLVFKV